MAQNRIHVTDRQQYKECRRKWHYASIEKLEPIDGLFGALWFGTGMHKVLEHYYRSQISGKQPELSELFNVWDAYVQEAVKLAKDMYIEDKILSLDTLAKAMIEQYVLFAKEADKNFEVVDVEKEIEIKIPGTRKKLVGTLDLLVKKGNSLYIVDHKTMSSFVSPEQLELDDQMTAYLWMAREIGLKVRGCIYNVLRKKAPTIPAVLKNGTLSKNKSIDTSAEVYLNKILELGLDPADYSDILETLKVSGEFVRRDTITRTKAALDNFGKSIADEVREMSSSRIPIYFHATQDCLWRCGFRQLCRCENDGGDVDYLKRVMYKVGEGRK